MLLFHQISALPCVPLRTKNLPFKPSSRHLAVLRGPFCSHPPANSPLPRAACFTSSEVRLGLFFRVRVTTKLMNSFPFVRWAGAVGVGLRFAVVASFFAPAWAAVAQDAGRGAPIELQAFIAEETALEDSNSLLPTDRTVSSVFLSDAALLDLPRAVTVLSPEAMAQFQIADFSDLGKVGAGTERYNFFGIAGAPVLRGWQGGIYFNGMLRAFQRNEMPTSFGSLEALDLVKGAAPAQFFPTHVGGYVNMIPKSPYFDAFRGSVEVEIGTHNHLRGQLDAGGPTLIGETPAAWRVSISAQAADSYYDDVFNDYLSVYAAVKARLSDRLRLFAGAEFYEFASNENAGWNRPTQALIDRGAYVIGEPLSLVRPGNGGVADRNYIDAFVNGGFDLGFARAPELFGYDDSQLEGVNLADFRALVVPAEVVDAAVAGDTISAAQREAMRNLADPAVRGAIYGNLPEDIEQTTSGYLYTPAYFDAGGTVFTASIDGHTVLSDPNDFADSQDFMAFADVTYDWTDDAQIENKLFFEALDTSKRSSYGYAAETSQWVLDNRLALTHRVELSDVLALTYEAGFQVRYNASVYLQDFWTEPFARRDLTRPAISANSVLLAGGQRDPLIGENNYWTGGVSPFGAFEGFGTNAAQSELLQTGTFLTTAWDIAERLTLIAAARYGTADYAVQSPDAPTNLTPTRLEDDLDYLNWSVNPVWRVTPSVSVYGVYQEATTFAPTDGGGIIGEENFGDAELTEGGVKVSLVEGRLFATVAIYEWTQGGFNARTQRRNEFESEGLELELTWQVTDRVTVIAAYGERETRRTNGLGFRTMDFSLADPTGAGDAELGIALEAGALFSPFSDAAFSAGVGGDGPGTEGSFPSRNPELIVPGAPEETAKLFAVVTLPAGFELSGGVNWHAAYWHNYDHTLRLPSATIINLGAKWERGPWRIRLNVENATDEAYFLGADPEFAANTLVTQAPGPEAKLTLRWAF